MKLCMSVVLRSAFSYQVAAAGSGRNTAPTFHAEVEIHNEVHLALRCGLVEFDVVYEAFRHLLRNRVVMRTEIVA